MQTIFRWLSDHIDIGDWIAVTAVVVAGLALRSARRQAKAGEASATAAIEALPAVKESAAAARAAASEAKRSADAGESSASTARDMVPLAQASADAANRATPTVTSMNRVFYQPETYNGHSLSFPPSGLDRHERTVGWFALVTQGVHGVLAGIPVRYSAEDASHQGGDPRVTASWDGGPTAASVARILIHTNGCWEPASALVDWDAPNRVDVQLHVGVQLTLYSSSPDEPAGGPEPVEA